MEYEGSGTFMVLLTVMFPVAETLAPIVSAGHGKRPSELEPEGPTADRRKNSNSDAGPPHALEASASKDCTDTQPHAHAIPETNRTSYA